MRKPHIIEVILIVFIIGSFALAIRNWPKESIMESSSEWQIPSTKPRQQAPPETKQQESDLAPAVSEKDSKLSEELIRDMLLAYKNAQIKQENFKKDYAQKKAEDEERKQARRASRLQEMEKFCTGMPGEPICEAWEELGEDDQAKLYEDARDCFFVQETPMKDAMRPKYGPITASPIDYDEKYITRLFVRYREECLSPAELLSFREMHQECKKRYYPLDIENEEVNGLPLVKWGYDPNEARVRKMNAAAFKAWAATVKASDCDGVSERGFTSLRCLLDAATP